jgi:hypothetical protein
MSLPGWLPSLCLMSHCGNDWQTYVSAVYELYLDGFVRSQPSFEGMRVGRKRYPEHAGKEFAFWHLVSEGKEEDERIPDLRRCERMSWPRAIVDHAADPAVRVWRNRRGTEVRACLWVPDADFLVVLGVRKTYAVLWTAYPVTHAHRKAKLEKEWLAWKAQGANTQKS